MARLLMAIVVVFLCCHSTKIIVNFYEAVQVILRLNVGNDDDDDCGGQYSVTSLVTSQCRGAGPRLLTNFASFPNSLPSSPDATYFPTTHSQGRGWSKGGLYYMIYDDLESDCEL